MTSALSTAQIKKLNKMNRAAADATLGTRLSGFGLSGSYTVVAGEATASRVVITTGLSAVKGQMVLAARSGSPMNSYFNTVAGSVAGTLDIRGATNVSGSPMAAGDVLTWVAF